MTLYSLFLAGTVLAQAPLSSVSPQVTLDRAQAAMIIDPKKVIALVDEARTMLPTSGDTRATGLLRTRALWLESEARGRLGELHRAEASAIEGIKAIERMQPGGKLHGDLLMTRGAVALDKNEMQRAFELFRRAYAIFQANRDTRAQAIALQNIGTIYSYAGDQRSVLRYYAQAAEVHPGDPGLAQTAANNLGTAYKELGQLERADAQFRQALVLAVRIGSPVLEVRALNNLASVALLRGRIAEATRSVDQGLLIASKGDAAEWAPFLWGVKAQIAFQRGEIAQAVLLFERTFAGEDLAETGFYFRDFHQSATDVYRGAGSMDKALEHLQALKRLDDEAREIRSSTNAALSAAQFDFANQELKIAKLRQQKLQSQARQQTMMLIGSLLLLLVTLAAFFWVRRSRDETRTINRALDKALKAKSEFLATTSHEIRTPLNGILGMTQVLMGRRGLDGAVREQVRIIDSAGNTMKAIVDDILDMAQIEQRQIEIDRTDIALPALVADVAGLWRAAAEAKGVALVIDTDDAPQIVREDERKLRQICFNLLANAVKFTAAGTVRLHVSTSAKAGADRLIVAIADTGIGIAPDQMGVIFEPFRQADGGTTRRFGGTGLGLAISSKLAEAMGGRITVTSDVDAGSCFTLSLPLHNVDVPVALDVSYEPVVDLAQARVVLIESNPLFASMTTACLEPAVASIESVDDSIDVVLACDIILLGDASSAAEVASLRHRFPDALMVLIGGCDAATTILVDGVVEREMPPLHLASALQKVIASRVAGGQFSKVAA